ncbi:PilZ domain-containing protein [Treponema primitia]|uniref:PilZ domain-containing protein n=1 Tax=Treponema primitia TaxID=88058 RepID=UPI0039818E01
MKLLVILGSDEILNLISQNIKPLGFDLIRYQYVLKAMDNIEEIEPSTIIISAKDFPRHWKVLVQFVRYAHSKAECPIIILKGPNFTMEEASKAFYMGVSGIVSEDLTKPSEVDQLQRLLSRYLQLEEKRRNNRYHIDDPKEMGICVVNPVNKGLIPGEVKTISSTGISFLPESTANLDTLEENMELAECSLRIGEDFITPICRVVRTSPDMSLEFIFLPDVDRILLDNYLEALPLQARKEKKAE